MKFKDFSRTPPEIQGLFKDVRTLENICCLMHDVRHGKAPKNIIDLLIDIKTVHSYNTCAAASRNFYVKPSKLQIQYKAFSRVGARVWKEIPTFLRENLKNN